MTLIATASSLLGQRDLELAYFEPEVTVTVVLPVIAGVARSVAVTVCGPASYLIPVALTIRE